MHRPRASVRLRLTLTYTALFVVTGVGLLGVSYLLVRQRASGPSVAVRIICSHTGSVLGARGAIGILPVPAPSALSPAVCSGLVGASYHSSGTSAGVAFGSSSGGAPTHASPQLPGPAAAGPAAEVQRLAETIKASQAQTLDGFKVDSAVALGLLTLVSLGLSWWMAGRALRPVHRITDAARALSEQTLHARINLQGPNDELKELADTFDAMLGRLERAFHSQRRFVANASHELRTPLATERVLIDEALAHPSASPGEMRSILEQLRTNSEETERLIDALLVLARSERGIEQWSPVELAATVSTVVEQSAGEAAGAGITVTTRLEPVTVGGDPGLLQRLAGNLVENAIRHNRPGGSVSVSTGRDADAALLDVVNTGPVIAADTVTTLVEPFRRSGPDRSATTGGAGLGLSIADAIVGAHRGTMDLEACDGGGLRVRVRLPAGNRAAGG